MRSRNVKPGFFQNEHLAELPPETRLLFIGLWLMADREGRLEDRPKRIKMQIFPADTFNVDPMLDDLQSAGLIMRYEVDSAGFICIPAWHKHQNPHHKERASDIPAPERPGQDLGKPQSCRGKERDDRADSGFLIPDSLIPDSGGTARKRAPQDYEPSQSVLDELAAETNLPPDSLQSLLREMKDHEFRSAKKDWNAVFRNWVRRSVKWEKQNPGRKLSYAEQLREDMRSLDASNG